MNIRIFFISICFLILSFVHPVSAQEYSLLLTFKVITKTHTLEFVRATLVQGEAPINRFQPSDGYALKLFSSDRRELYTMLFVAPSSPEGSLPQAEWFNKKGEQIHIPEPNEVPAIPNIKEIPFSVMVPYIEGIRTLEVYDSENKKVITATVPMEDDLVKDFIVQEEKIQFIEKQQQVKKDAGTQQEPMKQPENVHASALKRDFLILLLGIAGIGGVGLIVWALSVLRKKK